MPERQNSLGRRVHCLSNACKRELDRAASGSSELREIITGGNGRILCFLEHNRERDIYLRDLEKEFGITPSTASRTVRLMEKKGLVRVESVSDDARLKKLTLTEKSARLTRSLHENALRLAQRLVSGFTPEEIAAFQSYLDRALQNLPGCNSENSEDPEISDKGETHD